jgi:hypothetical protein
VQSIPSRPGSTFFIDSDGTIDVNVIDRLGKQVCLYRAYEGKHLYKTDGMRNLGILQPLHLLAGPYLDYLPYYMRVMEGDLLLGRQGVLGWDNVPRDWSTKLAGPMPEMDPGLSSWQRIFLNLDEHPQATWVYVGVGTALVLGGIVLTVATGGLAGFVIGGALIGGGFGFGVTGAATNNLGAALTAGAIGAVAGGIGGAASYGVLAAAGGLAAVGGMSLLSQVGIGALAGGAGGFAGGFSGGTLGGLAAGQSWDQALQSGWESGKTGAIWGAAFGAAIPLVAAGLRYASGAGGAAGVKKTFFSYYEGEMDASGAFSASSGRVYMTTKAPGEWLTQNGILPSVRRLVRTGRWTPYSSQDTYFTTGSVNPSTFGLSRIMPRTGNFWKFFGEQYHTRIGVSGFDVSPNSNILLPRPIASTSGQIFQATAGAAAESALDVMTAIEAAGAYYIWRESRPYRR